MVWDLGKLNEFFVMVIWYDDYFVGICVVDWFEGLVGDDIYVVNYYGDVIVEKCGEGVDMVMSSVSFSLMFELEWLELIGNGNIDGFGNVGVNYIFGNWGRNVFDGGVGDDYFVGGGGGDIYFFGKGFGNDNIDISDGDGNDDDCVRIGVGVSM